ncbi:hypothetical protein M2146_001152 [Lachnospiraceae bacterium PF1-22]
MRLKKISQKIICFCLVAVIFAAPALMNIKATDLFESNQSISIKGKIDTDLSNITAKLYQADNFESPLQETIIEEGNFLFENITEGQYQINYFCNDIDLSVYTSEGDITLSNGSTDFFAFSIFEVKANRNTDVEVNGCILNIDNEPVTNSSTTNESNTPIISYTNDFSTLGIESSPLDDWTYSFKSGSSYETAEEATNVTISSEKQTFFYFLEFKREADESEAIKPGDLIIKFKGNESGYFDFSENGKMSDLAGRALESMWNITYQEGTLILSNRFSIDANENFYGSAEFTAIYTSIYMEDPTDLVVTPEITLNSGEGVGTIELPKTIITPIYKKISYKPTKSAISLGNYKEVKNLTSNYEDYTWIKWKINTSKDGLGGTPTNFVFTENVPVASLVFFEDGTSLPVNEGKVSFERNINIIDNTFYLYIAYPASVTGINTNTLELKTIFADESFETLDYSINFDIENFIITEDPNEYIFKISKFTSSIIRKGNTELRANDHIEFDNCVDIPFDLQYNFLDNIKITYSDGTSKELPHFDFYEAPSLGADFIMQNNGTYKSFSNYTATYINTEGDLKEHVSSGSYVAYYHPSDNNYRIKSIYYHNQTFSSSLAMSMSSRGGFLWSLNKDNADVKKFLTDPGAKVSISSSIIPYVKGVRVYPDKIDETFAEFDMNNYNGPTIRSTSETSVEKNLYSTNMDVSMIGDTHGDGIVKRDFNARIGLPYEYTDYLSQIVEPLSLSSFDIIIDINAPTLFTGENTYSLDFSNVIDSMELLTSNYYIHPNGDADASVPLTLEYLKSKFTLEKINDRRCRGRFNFEDDILYRPVTTWPGIYYTGLIQFNFSAIKDITKSDMEDASWANSTYASVYLIRMNDQYLPEQGENTDYIVKWEYYDYDYRDIDGDGDTSKVFPKGYDFFTDMGAEYRSTFVKLKKYVSNDTTSSTTALQTEPNSLYTYTIQPLNTNSFRGIEIIDEIEKHSNSSWQGTFEDVTYKCAISNSKDGQPQDKHRISLKINNTWRTYKERNNWGDYRHYPISADDKEKVTAVKFEIAGYNTITHGITLNITMRSPEEKRDTLAVNKTTMKWTQKGGPNEYPIVPENTLSSNITKVAVTDEDKYLVNYIYTDASVLPPDVNETIPNDLKLYDDNTTVPAQLPNGTTITSSVDGKTYRFNGWDENEKTIEGEDITFYGNWSILDGTEVDYRLSYKFRSDTPDKDLPQEVMELLPFDNTSYITGDSPVLVDLYGKEVVVADGKWVAGAAYEPNSVTFIDHDEEVILPWVFEELSEKNTDLTIIKLDSKGRDDQALDVAFDLYSDKELTTKVNSENIVPTEGTSTCEIKDLAPGTYYLVETKAPKGHSLLTNPVKVELVYDGDDFKVKLDGTEYNNSTLDGRLTIDTDSSDNNLVSLKIQDGTNFKLPITGGKGILFIIVSICSLILLISSVLLFSTNKKRRKVSK